MSDEEHISDAVGWKPPTAATVPPDGKVTLQLALTILLGFIVLLGVARDFFSAHPNSATDHLLMFAAGGVAGLLTGGYGKHTR